MFGWLRRRRSTESMDTVMLFENVALARGFLERLVPLFADGFTSEDVPEVVGALETIAPNEQLNTTYDVTHRGQETTFTIVIDREGNGPAVVTFRGDQTLMFDLIGVRGRWGRELDLD